MARGDWRWDWRWAGRREWCRIDILNRGATGRSNFVVDGILRGLTESIVARTTNLTVHYVGAALMCWALQMCPVS
jgi:hypothetical protein